MVWWLLQGRAHQGNVWLRSLLTKEVERRTFHFAVGHAFLFVHPQFVYRFVPLSGAHCFGIGSSQQRKQKQARKKSIHQTKISLWNICISLLKHHCFGWLVGGFGPFPRTYWWSLSLYRLLAEGFGAAGGIATFGHSKLLRYQRNWRFILTHSNQKHSLTYLVFQPSWQNVWKIYFVICDSNIISHVPTINWSICIIYI